MQESTLRKEIARIRKDLLAEIVRHRSCANDSRLSSGNRAVSAKRLEDAKAIHRKITRALKLKD